MNDCRTPPPLSANALARFRAAPQIATPMPSPSEKAEADVLERIEHDKKELEARRKLPAPGQIRRAATRRLC
jgi:hypothetical protein